MKSHPLLTPDALVRLCREAALDKKAEDVAILDLRGISNVADYFLLCDGRSEPQLKAIADSITDRVRQAGERPIGHEGNAASRWLVVDYGAVIVHIFHPEVRHRYALEQLWGDAKRLE